ncbi:response regulator receiver [Nitrobacter sp. Nb-311A]|uniref:response regulator n=2 Tax=unclassified Nitrobacter TaxID=2620411 RepID=UPI00006863EC|nr:response regulator receiver [Nitrobacter sp. Nb-311A]
MEVMHPIVPDGPASSPAGIPRDVLIVEDDVIIAIDIEQTVAEFGVASVRTSSNVAQALAMITERAPDFALLDVSLSEENSFAIAKVLAALKVPFVFVTGYSGDKAFPAEYSDRSRLSKPFLRDELFAILSNWRNGGVG